MNLNLHHMFLYDPEQAAGTEQVDESGIPNIEPREKIGPWENMSEIKPPEGDGLPEPAAAQPEPDQVTTPEEVHPEETQATSEGEKDPQQPAEAKEADAPPATESSAAEEGETPEALQKILDKYDQDPAKLSAAVRALRGLQSETAEERNRLQETINEYFEVGADGALVPNVSAMARALGQQRGQAPQQRQIPTEAELAKAETEKVRQALRSGHPDLEASEIDGQVRSLTPVIKESAKRQHQELLATQQAQAMQAASELHAQIAQFKSQNPDFEKLEPQIFRWYDGIPDELKPNCLELIPLQRVYNAEKMSANMESMIKEAFDAGVAHARSAVEPSDAEKPAQGARAQRQTETVDDPDQEFKARLVGANGMVTLGQAMRGGA